MIEYTTWIEAENESQIYYELYVGSISGKTGQNDDVDAFRHAYVSGVYAMERGDFYANALGWANEIKGDWLNKQPVVQKNMDLWNNEVGRDLAATAASKADLAQKIAVAMGLGDLIVDLSDARVFSDSKPTLTIAQLNDLSTNHSDALEPMSPDGVGENEGVDVSLLSILQDLVRTIFGASETAELVDPLIIDLNNDGNIGLNAGETVYFDVDGDAFAESLNWVSADDGLLTYDINGNGNIDNVTELFGDAGTDGFMALSAYDANIDGVIDALDAVWSDLRVWQDVNQDGYSQSDELLTLDSLGITGINLASTLNTTDPDITHDGSVTTSGGSLRISNANFTVDDVNTRYADDYDFDIAMAFLPTLRGYSQIADLHIAGSIDTSTDAGGDTIKDKLTSLAGYDLGGLFANYDTALTEVRTLLFHWAGVEGIAANARGEYLTDARELEFLERYLNDDFIGTQFNNTDPGAWQAPVIERAWETAFETLAGNILFQAAAGTLYESGPSYALGADKVESAGGLLLSQNALDDLTAQAQGLADTAARIEFWRDVADLLHKVGASYDDAGVDAYVLSPAEEAKLDAAIAASDASLTWYAEDHDVGGLTAIESVHGGIGGDVFVGVDGTNHTYAGTAFGDSITGANLTDTFFGGEGDDIIYGGGNADTLFGEGGNDTIYGDFSTPNFNNNDTIDGGSGDDYIEGGFGDDTINGGADNDEIDGGEGVDTIDGGTGSDFLRGGTGDDILIDGYGTSGQNLLEGGAGADIYRIQGDGAEVYINGDEYDTIELPAGFTDEDDLDFFRIGSMLWITGTKGGDSVNIYINNQLPNTLISDLKFDSGYVFDLGDVLDRITTYGTPIDDVIDSVVTAPGNIITDTVYADGGNDVVHGNGGDDFLYGESGNDTLYGEDGADFIDGGTDDDVIYGGAAHDTLYGGEGNDTIYGGDDDDTMVGHGANPFLDGNDYFDGGAGDDAAQGGAGDDTYFFGDGRETYIETLGNDTVLVSSLYASSGLQYFRHIDGANNYNLTLRFDNQTLDFDDPNRIILKDHFLSADKGFETLYFEADSSQISLIGLTVDTHGSVGADSINGIQANGNLNETIYAYGGADTVNAGNGDDTIYGDAGDDILDGGFGSDTIYGGADHDTIYGGGSGNDILHGDGGNDTLFGGNGNDTLYGDDGNDTLRGEAGADHLIGGGGIDDFYAGSGDDILEGGADNDIMRGEDGADTLYGDDGDDQLYGQEQNDELHGGAGNDIVAGGGHNDVMYGDDGDDQMYGGQNDDQIFGGTGKDTYNYYVAETFEGVDVIFDAHGENDSINVGGGFRATDVTITNVGDYDIEITFVGKPGDKITVLGQRNTALTQQIEKIVFDDGSELVLYQPPSGETIIGTSANNVLNGTAGDDQIEGLAGHDTIYGAAGNDTLIGGTGNDTLHGDDGDDTFLINGSGDGVDRIYGGSGTDTIQGSAGDDNIQLSRLDAADSVEVIDGGAGANTLSGNASNNVLDFSATTLINIDRIDGGNGQDTITGSAGNDTIVGGAGNDTLSGGDGDDIFLISGVGDGVDRIYGGNGTDTILGSAGTDTIQLSRLDTADSIEVIDGGLGSNAVAGNASNNVLDFSATTLVNIGHINGMGGHDTITGSAGNDTIIGAAGNDTLRGDDGDDIFIINGSGDGVDRVYGGTGTDTIQGSSGDDTIQLSRLDAADSVEVIDGVSGTDAVAGNASNNVLDFSATTLTNIARIEGLNGHDTITGSAGNDMIVGGTGNDTLRGGAGDDVFLINGTGDGVDRVYGEGGSDTILGSAGDDDIQLSRLDAADSVEVIDGGAGNNRVLGSASNNVLDFTATTLLGIAAIEGLGGHDTITGSAGNDIIIGGAGNDTLRGEDGDDTFIINGSGDGVDRIYGGAGTDTIQGGAGDDTIQLSRLDAADSIDVIDGGLGTNVVAGNASNNVLDFSAAALSNIDHIDGGAGHDTITGSAGADAVKGGSGNDTIKGGSGDDILYGEDGLDGLWGELGADIFVFESAAAFNNVDIIHDFSTAEGDAINIADLLTGYDSLTDAIEDFVQITDNGTHSYLAVDTDGGADNFVQIAELRNVTGLTDEDALETAGNLIAA